MMDEFGEQPIEQLVQQYQRKELTRRRFITLLTVMGASATGIATLVASAERTTAAASPALLTRVHPHKKLHTDHVRLQSAVTHGSRTQQIDPRLQMLLNDYADHAIVEDPLFAGPIVGKEAITQRKMAEVAAMSGITIEVANRFAHHNQVVAEWIVRGTHDGHFMGFPATGRSIEIRGVTVVTREDGKITKESLHYDVDDLRRQLG